jgi:hypothetical protein
MQPVNRDILIVRFCQRPLIEQHMGKSTQFVNLFEKHIISENHRGITANIYGPRYLVDARSVHHNGSTLIHRLL